MCVVDKEETISYLFPKCTLEKTGDSIFTVQLSREPGLVEFRLPFTESCCFETNGKIYLFSSIKVKKTKACL